MKWITAAALVGVCALARPAVAQEVLPIGEVATVADKGASTWAISGFEMFRLSQSAGKDTPIMRTEKCDARATEIFSRATAPALRKSDIKVMGNKIIVRRYLLLEVTPADAKAEGMSISALAAKWAAQPDNICRKCNLSVVASAFRAYLY